MKLVINTYIAICIIEQRLLFQKFNIDDEKQNIVISGGYQNIQENQKSRSTRFISRHYSTMINIKEGINNIKDSNKKPQHIQKLKPFIVVNILILEYMKRYQQLKIPYSAAFIMVRPNHPIVWKENQLFSPEYSPVMMVRPNQLPVKKPISKFSPVDSRITNFLTERGIQLVHSLLTSLRRVVKNERRSINVYFTNINRDDGYSILRNSLIHPYPYNLDLKCSPLTRYNNLSNMRVYSTVNNRLLFKVRDFNDLLCSFPQDELVNMFCQKHCYRECDTKMISIHNLKKYDYIKYMKHDIMLHAAIMQKAQELHWRNFQIDLFYKRNIVEKEKKTPNLRIANMLKTISCSCQDNKRVRKRKIDKNDP